MVNSLDKECERYLAPYNCIKLLFLLSLSDKLSSTSSNANKRQKLAQDFLISIDQTGELLTLFEDDEIDDVKQERMEVSFGLILLAPK